MNNSLCQQPRFIRLHSLIWISIKPRCRHSVKFSAYLPSLKIFWLKLPIQSMTHLAYDIIRPQGFGLNGEVLLWSHALKPRQLWTELLWTVLDGSRSSGTLGAPILLFARHSTRYIWHVLHPDILHFYYILVYGNNLIFVCSFPPNPYVLFSEPRFCFIRCAQPLQYTFCVLLTYCFPLLVMHSSIR